MVVGGDYANWHEPYPFKLEAPVVSRVHFSWDEMCDKFRAESHKIGDYKVATAQGKPPPNASNLLNAAAEDGSSQVPITPTTTFGKGRPSGYSFGRSGNWNGQGLYSASSGAREDS